MNQPGFIQTLPTDPTSRRAKAAEQEGRFFQEVNVLKIEGRYFSFAARKNRKTNPKPADSIAQLSKKEIVRRMREAPAEQASDVWVVPDPRFGHPGEMAYKVFQAISKKVSDTGPTFNGSLVFSLRELATLCGRRSIGGKDVRQVYQAIQQLRKTDVVYRFYDKRTRKTSVQAFTIINKEQYEKTDDQDDDEMGISITLEPLIVESLRAKYFMCLNYAHLRELPDALTQALYKRLFYHFSNIKKEHTFETFPLFKKSYEDICQEWFFGLVPLKYRSRILQEQLGKHLAALQQVELLSFYDIVKKKAGSGFNLECLPGRAFFEDYARFYQRGLLPADPEPKSVEAIEDSPALLARDFLRKRYGASRAGDGAVPAHPDLEFARELLAKHPYEECLAFIDFALEEAKKTDFNVKMLRGLRQYHGAFLAYLETRERRQAEHEARALRDLKEKLAQEYELFRRARIEEIRAGLDPAVLAEREAAERTKACKGLPVVYAADRTARIRIDEQLAQEHPLPSFEEWKVSRTPGVPTSTPRKLL